MSNAVSRDYDERYGQSEYYWGVKPSTLCFEVLKYFPFNRPIRLLDIGCGEGRDAVFVEKPFIAPAPDGEAGATLWRSGELFSVYHDWKFEVCTEVIFDCMSSGIPRQHAVNRLIARKMPVEKPLLESPISMASPESI